MITFDIEVLCTAARRVLKVWQHLVRRPRHHRLAACSARATVPGFLLLLPLSALAQNLTLTGDATFTAVSGYAGGNETRGATDGSRGITAITWYEDGDEPCKLVLDTKDFNTRDINNPQVVLKDVYTHTGKQPCSSPGNRKAVRLAGTDNWIYKIQTCTTDKRNTSNNKLKGIRIWAATVNQRSPLSVSRGSSFQEAKHTHCSKWRTAVACPQGKIASRLRVHHNGSKTKAIGLALECRTLSPG